MILVIDLTLEIRNLTFNLFMFSSSEKSFLLSLAKESIEYFATTGMIFDISEAELPTKKLAEPLACFITLTINNKLRGCIGHLETSQPLYKEVIGDAISAAFNDTRFEPLSRKEFEQLETEISVLTKPKEIKFSSPEDLLNKINSDIDGIIIEKDNNNATYLPQVWEDLPSKEEFLSSLCLKAGFNEDEWKKPGMKIYNYQVEIVK